METHEEKEAHEVKTKANPNKAVNEPQPGTEHQEHRAWCMKGVTDSCLAAWSLEKSTIANLRSMEHKDMHGNPIGMADPSIVADRSSH